MRKLILTLLFVLIATTAYARYVTVSWEAVVGATSYKLYWDTETGQGTDAEHYLNVGNVTEYTLAVDQDDIYMTVAAVDGDGEGPLGTEVLIPLTSTVTTTITGISASGVTFQ